MLRENFEIEVMCEINNNVVLFLIIIWFLGIKYISSIEGIYIIFINIMGNREDNIKIL